jgi:prepilin-type N-terminal cleavage/methylation domain-containing protein
MRKNKANAGYTLTELIVAIAVATIMLGIVALITARTVSVITAANELSETNRILDTISDEITASMEQAVAPIVSMPDGSIAVTTYTHTIIYSVDTDKLLCKSVDGETAKPVFEESYYHSKGIALQCAEHAGAQDPCYDVTITLLDSIGAEIAQRTYSVSPAVLAQ